jgi:hypothetical protein
LAGYTDGLTDDEPHPFVLAERHDRLRRMALARLQKPLAEFWDDLKKDLLPVDGAIDPCTAPELCAWPVVCGLAG